MYYDAKTGDCTACDQSCATCSGPASSQCLSCPSSTSLVNGSCIAGCFPACSSGYQCNTSTSTCTQLLSLRLLQTQKLLSSNTLRLTLQLSPAIEAPTNLSSILSVNLPNVSYSYSPSSGLLTLDSTYNTSLQNSSVTITPSASLGGLLWSDASTFSFTVEPDNNVQAEYYDQGVYDKVKVMEVLGMVLMYMAITTFCLSLLSSKFIGVEMIGVIQAAYIGLIVVDNLPPMLAPLSEITFVNGINNYFNEAKYQYQMESLPKRISSLNY